MKPEVTQAGWFLLHCVDCDSPLEGPREHLRGDERLVAERDDDRVDVAELGDAMTQRGGHALRPLRAHGHFGAVEVDARPDLLGTRAEDDQHGIDRRHRRHRADRVLEHRPAAHGRQLLGPAEAPSFAGGEDEPADHRRAHVSSPPP